MKTRRILKVVVVGLLGMACTSYAAEGTWTRKTDMPTARMGFSTSVMGGKIYAIGGSLSLYVAALPTVEEYDPATDTWTKKVDMSGVRNMHSAAVVNGKIYIIGGATAPNVIVPTVQEYDPATETWTLKADMPTARAFLSACEVNGKIYAIGGVSDISTGLSSVEEYDPVTDTWVRKADMLTARACLSTSVVNGKIYAIGGGWRDALSTMEEYDPATDTWTKKTDMPITGKSVSTSVMNGKIYAIGGATGGFGPVNSAVHEYDPTTDTWSTRDDMPTARWFHSTSTVNGKIYAIGGETGYNQGVISTVEEYDLTPPPPDFNGDGIVDIKDLLRLIQSWDRDDPLVDISPIFGDGVIDVLDLELLMSYWKQPIDDPTLIVHWTLDEEEGIFAYDSAGVNDAVVLGGIEWQPTSGQIDGALKLDGVSGYALTGSVLNPADGPFSVLAWINGGAPGHVVVSQQNAANWLAADAEGNLMTELKSSDQLAESLLSETVITDGQWHRIGLVWDGSNRILYVDGVAVADDIQLGLEGSENGLNIGAGNMTQPGSFWFGMIDDIRIYNRAVHP